MSINIGDIEVSLDKITGHITSITKDGKVVVLDGPQLNFWRPPTDNDEVDGHGELLWRRIGLDNLKWQLDDYKIVDYMKDSCLWVYIRKTALNENDERVFGIIEQLIFRNSGDIMILYNINPADWIPSLPKIGIQMKVSDELVTTEWVGYSQETYPDRKACGFVGHYEAPTDYLFHHYVRPQAAGNRMGIRYISLFNKEHQRMLSAQLENQTCQFSIYPYDDKNIEQSKHTNKLVRAKYYTLNIDYAQAGLGTATCGPDISDKDLLKAKNIKFELQLQIGEQIPSEKINNEKLCKGYCESFDGSITSVRGKRFIHLSLNALNNPTSPYNDDIDILTDGQIGNPANFHEGWIGYFGVPMKLQCKFDKSQEDSLTVTLSFAHHPSQWVFLPQKVIVSYSKNGKKYSQPEEVELPFDPMLEENSKPKVYILRHKIPNKNIKYVRIEAEPVEQLPSWHPAAGEKAWIMTDEVKIK